MIFGVDYFCNEIVGVTTLPANQKNIFPRNIMLFCFIVGVAPDSQNPISITQYPAAVVQASRRDQEHGQQDQQQRQVEPWVQVSCTQNCVVDRILGVGERRQVRQNSRPGSHFAQWYKDTTDKEQRPADQGAGHHNAAYRLNGDRAKDQAEGRKSQAGQQQPCQQQGGVGDGDVQKQHPDQ